MIPAKLQSSGELSSTLDRPVSVGTNSLKLRGEARGAELPPDARRMHRHAGRFCKKNFKLHVALLQNGKPAVPIGACRDSALQATSFVRGERVPAC